MPGFAGTSSDPLPGPRELRIASRNWSAGFWEPMAKLGRCGAGLGTRCLELGLRFGPGRNRRGRWRRLLHLGGRRRRQRRRQGLVQGLERFLVDLRRLLRHRLHLHFGLRAFEQIGRQIKVFQVVLALPDGIKRVNNRRDLEDVLRDPGEGREQDQVDQDGDPDAFTQTCPAALVFELADHLQQFVGVVVDPARSAHDRRHIAPGTRAVRFSSELKSGVRDGSTPATGFAARPFSGPCAGLAVSGAVPAGSLGSFTLVGTTLSGIGPMEPRRTLPPAGSVSSPFSRILSSPSNSRKPTGRMALPLSGACWRSPPAPEQHAPYNGLLVFEWTDQRPEGDRD